MSTKNASVKKHLISEIENVLANEPDLVIERDGHQWVALPTDFWLQVLDGEVSESTFRRWISKPPFVRRVFVITEADAHYPLDREYERTLCLRLGEDEKSTTDRAKQLSSIYRQSVPKKPEGYLAPGYDDYDAHVEPTKTGWKAPDRFDLWPHFMKLADLWGEDAPRIFENTVKRWPDFIVMCDGVDRKLNFPSVRTMLKHEATARQLWAYNRKTKATARKLADAKKAA